MTGKELKRIYYLNKELKMWQQELDNLQCQTLAKGQQLTGMPFGTDTADKTAELATAIVETTNVINGILSNIQIERRRIISYISNIEDPLVRQIIFLRNVSLMSWDKVAQELGGGNTAESVRKIHERYLKEN